MSRKATLLLTILTIAVDVIMASVAFFLSYQLRALIPIPSPLMMGPFRGFLGLMGLNVAALLVTFFFFRLYHPRRGSSRIDLFYTILSAVSVTTVVATAFTYLVSKSGRDLTRGMILYGWVLTIVMVTLGRVVTGWVEKAMRRRTPDRMLLVGTGEIAHMILQKTLQSPQLGYKVVGFIDGQGSRKDIGGIPVLGGRADLSRILREQDVQEVVIALPDASHGELLDLIAACETERATVRIFPDLFQIIASELRIGDLDGLPLLTVRDVALQGWKLSIKRMLDLVGSAIGLVFVSPLLLLIAVLVKLDSSGPAFYSQERVGLDGKPFPMLKFRSMRVDAEVVAGPQWAVADDPRRTRLGTLLRKTSLDELPQLINVLVGDMSLVGPRPERPIFVEQFKQVVPRYMDRHKEKAGITGWAQVNGLRGDTSIVERTKYDLYYIENWSLLFDLKILLRTFLNWFRGDRNAY
ncbi:MAG: undecaprenyl-phosphate glucose phosphotransferase [Anaerolineae bacterium]